MYKKQSWRRIKAILKSLKRGASINEACKGAGIDVVSLWSWRKKNDRLDTLVKEIYDSRIQIVEDALYKGALEGNVTSQIFFLKNRATNRWRDRTDIEGKGFGDTKIIIIKDGNKATEVPRGISVLRSEISGNNIFLMFF